MNNYFNKKILRINAIILSFLILSVISVKGQDTIQVKGIIVNSSNKPLADVSVAIEGSKEIPFITNQTGEFILNNIPGDCWLNISPSNNYKKRRILLNNRSYLKIYLTSNDVESGDDQIKILSLNLLKKDVISSFSSVNTKDISSTPALSVDNFLEGRVPGLNVINRNGDPGSGTATFTHGINSIFATNQPLYIVDGVPLVSKGLFQTNLDGYEYNPLLSINPLAISKISVIKGSVITSAYGSKASNGIVYIETLDPSATKTSIELDLRTGYSLSPEYQISQLSGVQYRSLASEILFSMGKPEEQIEKNYPGLFLTEDESEYIDFQHNTNWQNLVFSDAAFYNINVKINGGDEIASYGLMFGYTNNEGIIKNTSYDAYNLRFVSLLNIFSWLKMNASVSLLYNNSNLKESGLVSQTSPIMTSLAKSPLLNPFIYDDNKNMLTTLSDVNELGVSNPLAVINNYEATSSNFNFFTTVGFQATILENLKLYTNLGITYNKLKEDIFMPNIGMEMYYNKEAYNVSKLSNNALSGIYNNTYLKFNKTFGSNHVLSSITGLNVLSNRFEYDWGLTKNSHPNDQYRNLQDGTSNLREIGGKNRKWNWLSGYEYLTYSYKSKYLLSASLSLDASSRVGDNAANTIRIGVPVGLFYGGGIGWRISNESFMKNISAIDELKLRISYGVSGNDDIGESAASNYYYAAKYRETVGLIPALMPNDSLTYETLTQLNLGLDLSLWGNRFRTSVDFYNSDIDNMLVFTPIQAYFGFNNRLENNGKMQNRGIDLTMFVRIIDNKNFKWDFQTTFSKVKNEIVKIKGDKLIIPLRGATIVNMVGERANSFYGYLYEGVYSTTEEAEDAALVNGKMVSFRAGDAKFKDISGPNGIPDNVINEYDKTIIGSSIPDFFGGVNNTFIYKRWALNVFIQYVYGNDVFNYVRSQNESMKGMENQSTVVLNRWISEGQKTNIPRALYNDVQGNSDFSTRWIEDGSYLRLKDISLSYTVPDGFLVFKNAKFYFNASNLFTLTNYLGYDPEFSYSYQSITQGIDYGLTPNHREYVFGVKLGF